jgi:hypothetical protein
MSDQRIRLQLAVAVLLELHLLPVMMAQIHPFQAQA